MCQFGSKAAVSIASQWDSDIRRLGLDKGGPWLNSFFRECAGISQRPWRLGAQKEGHGKVIKTNYWLWSSIHTTLVGHSIEAKILCYATEHSATVLASSSARGQPCKLCPEAFPARRDTPQRCWLACESYEFYAKHAHSTWQWPATWACNRDLFAKILPRCFPPPWAS